MRQVILATGVLSLLAACDTGGTNPFDSTDTTDTTTTDDGTAIDSNRTLPPGTASPTASSTIFRREAQDGTSGNGYAESFVYDAAADTFTVDGLAFDGDNTYQRDDVVGSLGPYAVYEADQNVTDTFDGDVVGQFTYKALYGVSNSGNTEFAIVRTGSYTGYGFGGFIYQRSAGVTLPTSGQADYNGSYAGLRDFNGTGGLQYATGDMNVAIDFDDFNSGEGVRGTVSNRRVFDTNGNDITDSVLAAINADKDSSISALPTLIFNVGPSALDENGEIIGTLGSSFFDNNGNLVDFESGNYYALIAGDNAEEIVGVLVVEANIDTITARETGGFILYR